MTTRTSKIPNSVVARLSDLKSFFSRHRLIAGGLLAAIIVVILLSLIVDTSAELSTAQVQDVRAFVMRTRSAEVAEKFNDAIKDGRLTINETRAVIEVAKKAEPGYGFLSDQKITE